MKDNDKNFFVTLTALIKFCHEEYEQLSDNRLRWYIRGLLLENCLKNIKENEAGNN